MVCECERVFGDLISLYLLLQMAKRVTVTDLELCVAVQMQMSIPGGIKCKIYTAIAMTIMN